MPGIGPEECLLEDILGDGTQTTCICTGSFGKVLMRMSSILASNNHAAIQRMRHMIGHHQLLILVQLWLLYLLVVLCTSRADSCPSGPGVPRASPARVQVWTRLERAQFPCHQDRTGVHEPARFPWHQARTGVHQPVGGFLAVSWQLEPARVRSSPSLGSARV